ncbi:hypothetical protein DL93DRAFT_2074921 [Clavulina sp. PMI_390]|nr:hypothetical protein DL93DRAFT_2074921 [Clavulina sp. PMI_390]
MRAAFVAIAVASALCVSASAHRDGSHQRKHRAPGHGLDGRQPHPHPDAEAGPVHGPHHERALDVVEPGSGNVTERGYQYTNIRATWYDLGLTACGQTYTNADYVVALSQSTFGYDYPSSYCNRPITISYGGKTANAKIVDSCVACSDHGSWCLDLSLDLFAYFGSTDLGVIAVDWSFDDESSGGETTSSAKKTTSTKAAAKTTSTHHTTSTKHSTTSTTKHTTSTTTTKPTTSKESTTSTTTKHTTTIVVSASRNATSTTTSSSPSATGNLASVVQVLLRFQSLLEAANSTSQ